RALQRFQRDAQERPVALRAFVKIDNPSPASRQWHFSGFRAGNVNARLHIALCLTTLTISVWAKDDAAIEGVVQLPPPTMERALNQRYGANTEAPLTPSNPPAAVVYLEGNFTANPKTTSRAVAQMSQKNMLFTPDLIAVRTGGAVEFPNLDDTYHNVFSYSKAKRFDLGRYRKNEKPGTVVFDKPGVITVHCEI